MIAESFERIHRSNLIGMGILPLQFLEGVNRTNLNLVGSELISIISTEAQSSEKDHLINTLSGIVSNQEGDLEKAELALKKALEAKPYDIQTTIRIAQVLIKKGKLEEAISVLSKSVIQNPNNLNLRQQYAEYLSVKNIEQAISELELINNRNPFNYI